MHRRHPLFHQYGLFPIPMITKCGHKGVWLLLLLALGLHVDRVAASSEAMDLLTRMQAAVRDLNYSGRLTYSREDELASFRIAHRAGETQESLVRLDSNVNSENVEAERFALTNFEHLNLPDQQAYAFDMGDEVWVAGHSCRIVVARPKDKYRFLHRYCINEDNGMLLRYSLMNRSQTVLEQLMFTQLDIADQASAAAQHSQRLAFTAESFNLPQTLSKHAQLATQLTATKEPSLVLGQWNFDSLPAGFRVVRVIPQMGKQETSQVVISDGLTSVSVFITPADPQESLDDLAYATGATHVLSEEVAGHAVTFVGEVPLTTLRSIQKGLRHLQ